MLSRLNDFSFNRLTKNTTLIGFSGANDILQAFQIN